MRVSGHRAIPLIVRLGGSAVVADPFKAFSTLAAA
jgi:hypothetical protein